MLAAFQQGIYIMVNDVTEWRMQKNSLNSKKNRALGENQREIGGVKMYVYVCACVFIVYL